MTATKFPENILFFFLPTHFEQNWFLYIASMKILFYMSWSVTFAFLLAAIMLL